MMQTVTVIVPAYNEGPALGANLVTLTDAFSVYADAYAFEYLVVDDGSTDETAAELRSFARYRRNVTVLTQERNYGLGRALRTAFAAASGEYTIVIDADLSYTPALAIELLERLHSADADVAFASAYMRGGSVVNVPPARRILSREANRLLSFAANGRYATFTCMVRAYRTAFLKTLVCTADGMEANAELLLDAIRKHGSLVEVPARLEWSIDRRSSSGRTNLRALAARTWAILRLSFSFRPALWLAVPGLFPGLLPLVVATLLLLHQPPAVVALGSLITVVIQYSSLAYFAGQMTVFITQLFTHARKAPSSRTSTI
jgi:glycosyltransferase involved in cell wall biosynthesis